MALIGGWKPPLRGSIRDLWTSIPLLTQTQEKLL